MSRWVQQRRGRKREEFASAPVDAFPKVRFALPVFSLIYSLFEYCLSTKPIFGFVITSVLRHLRPFFPRFVKMSAVPKKAAGNGYNCDDPTHNL